jgi:V8-like Glu-specific endopeptidase
MGICLISFRAIGAWAVIVPLFFTPLPSRAESFAAGPLQSWLHRAAVFSDDPEKIHDPRYPQSRTGEDKMFAPIGLVWTNSPVPHDTDTMSTLRLDMGTGFLVSPCYVLTDYHVVFGNRKSGPEAGLDYSMTFWAGGKKSRAIPVRHGKFNEVYWQDWALLRLDADAEHPCMGEDPDIGWIQLAPLRSGAARDKLLSTAGYPSDKSGQSLWRQDACRLFEEQDGAQYSGLWTTNCATRPRASGSPIFYIQDGALMVVALMQGHLGYIDGNEILLQWDPRRANLAVDIGKMLSSDGDILKLITGDIDRYRQIKTARTEPVDADPVGPSDNPPAAQPGTPSNIAPAAPSDHIPVTQPEPSRQGYEGVP